MERGSKQPLAGVQNIFCDTLYNIVFFAPSELMKIIEKMGESIFQISPEMLILYLTWNIIMLIIFFLRISLSCI